MARGLKVFGWLIAIVLVVGGLAVWFLASNLDNIAKRAIETVGSDTLGTPVRVSSVAISLADASATVGGLTIANPRGFYAENAFTLDSIEIAIDVDSVGSPEIVLSKIIVNQPNLNFEQQGGTSNLQALLDNLQRGTGQSSARAETEANEMKLVIKELRVNDTQASVVHDRLPAPLDLELGDIVLRNIGREGAGVTATAAARQIMEPLLERAMQEGQAKAKEQVEALVRKELDKQKDQALDAIREKFKFP
ncbi:MAG: hypothetical protein QNJ73_16045 [Gammaproteobacteria bacterium]|nr:hypothetical protein [Gammaproteobacteria bacterium]